MVIDSFDWFTLIFCHTAIYMNTVILSIADTRETHKTCAPFDMTSRPPYRCPLYRVNIGQFVKYLFKWVVTASAGASAVNMMVFVIVRFNNS